MNECNCNTTRGLPNLPAYDAGQRRARLFETPEERWAKARRSPTTYPVPFPYPKKGKWR